MFPKKSKSFDLKRSPADKGKNNKSFDFISLYKSAAGNGNSVVDEGGDGIDKENSFRSQNDTSHLGSPLKKKKVKQELLDISRINIDGPAVEPNLPNSPLNQSKVTSTPRTSNKDKSQVKSIMKNTSSDEAVDSSQVYYNNKPKKRNKSVSFMLEENEDVATKKTRSEESLAVGKKKTKDRLKPVKSTKVDVQEKKLKKLKKQQNRVVSEDSSMETEPAERSRQLNSQVNGVDESSSFSEENKKQEKTKKSKIHKNPKNTDFSTASTTSENNINEEKIDGKSKKLNKKKRKEKPTKLTDTDVEEPAAKSRKKDVKPEVIAENLENLSIGDNPHTLTSLLDEMTVVDKDRKKKSKRKKDKNDKQTSTETDNSEGTKEKVKWAKNWNRGKKTAADNVASVIVENLPLSLICNYKTVLTEHFEKCGPIKRIGVAEAYPDDSTGFTTTILFESEGAVTEALTEDGAVIAGNSIQVKRPLPPTETTVVVRSYAPLSDQSVCSTFSAHGRIRSIRRLVKGKKSMDTVFIEFDGPEAVRRAIELSKGAKVGGKKIHVAQFEVRKKKVKTSKAPTNKADSDGEADSEHSND
ncbi:uncharacterized protein LOC106132912 [Amyelois transitella]|uniref:uncharacterized protein LOC106132912 n=1 Tax=Amyelois transitella TaxID=680683 RepID=UPI00298F7A56|nr:uncharacterized protein LOC106132912 [Amyelois transitella]